MQKPSGTKTGRAGSAGTRAWVVALCLCAAGGCAKPLLSPDEPRSPFDRYDAVRAQHATQYTEDKFGRREPNLRARLEPKE